MGCFETDENVDLPSLTRVYAHRFTFKYIYSAWTTFPLIVKTQCRGRNAEGSTSDKWMGNIIQMRKEAVPFLESLGIPKPRSKEEWSYIFKEMGTFLAAKNFIVNCPLPVMEMPVAPIHDSKEALRFRAVCDERITPLTAATVTAVAGRKYVNKHFPKEAKHVFWGSVECGLVLPSISAWEVVSKEKFKTTGGYMCRFCKGGTGIRRSRPCGAWRTWSPG